MQRLVEISHILLDGSTGFCSNYLGVFYLAKTTLYTFPAFPGFQVSDFVIMVSLLTWGVVTWVVDYFDESE